MDKALILDRLEMLVSLCEETEPDVPTERHLFTEHSISVNTMIMEVRELTTGRKSVDPDSERDLIIKVMRESNKIWRLRNKVKNGDFDDLANLEMNETIEDFLAQGQKINAIKHYRQEMHDQFKEQVSLREAKDYVDAIHDDMKKRGMSR
jgi:ribosomal protein L7/L12